MTSKDDDTMPLPGFSQEFSTDITFDEDFIPTSQPQSSINSRTSRNSDTSFNKSSEEFSSQPILTSKTDDTLPPEAIIDQSTFENNKSADFIPDTETKRIKNTYANTELLCKKKLPMFGLVDDGRDQLNPTWDSDVSRIPESPALDTQSFSILKESPSKVLPSNVKRSEESITEIIVNDSAETVDLEATPVKIKKLEVAKTEKKTDVDCSAISDVERCEETQIFDNSSVLLLDQPGPSSLNLESEKISGVTPYLQETVDDNKENSQDRANGFPSLSSDAARSAFSRNPDNVKREIVDDAKLSQNEVQPKPNYTEPNTNAIISTKIDFKLVVSCLIKFNTATNKVMHKAILQVSESLNPEPKPTNVEHSDNTSEKSKRHSTSSSGSVYSDKTGLPFALPVRYSVISDQTDSSEEDFSAICRKGRRKLERTPWSNEYLLPLKMDDIIQAAIEKEEFLKRPGKSSPRKAKNKLGINLLQEILEGSSSSPTSLCNSEPPQSKKEDINDEKTESPIKSVPELEKTDENINKQNEADADNVGHVQSEDKQIQLADESETHEKQTIEQRQSEEETISMSLSDGLPVFARWTDKRYYSGVLCGSVKNDRWDVKFDDGTSKTVREELIMPVDWLKVGALVFALTDDKYESGQIIDIKRGKEVNYIVELDIKKKEVSVVVSDLCLTDVMAGIVREKYKPLSVTPRRADIDFDNVLSGRRLREQRTPQKLPITAGNGSSGAKKKSGKAKKDEGQNLAKEFPQNRDPETKVKVQKSDDDPLSEGKIKSADSPSGNEASETPLRGASKGAKGRAKPRSLSYETEDKYGKSWLAQDGTPVPGPSGVKFRKPKTKAQAEEPEKPFSEETDPVPPKSSKKSPARSKASQSSEKTKRKRKLDESVDENIQKKSLKGGSSKVKTRSKKG